MNNYNDNNRTSRIPPPKATTSSTRRQGSSMSDDMELLEPFLSGNNAAATLATLKSPPRHAFQLRSKQPAESPEQQQQQYQSISSPHEEQQQEEDGRTATTRSYNDGLTMHNNNNNNINNHNSWMLQEQDQDENNDGTDDDDDDDNNDDDDLERNLHLDMIYNTVWGKSYADNRFFWFQSIPITCFLGGIIGVLTFGFGYIIMRIMHLSNHVLLVQQQQQQHSSSRMLAQEGRIIKDADDNNITSANRVESILLLVLQQQHHHLKMWIPTSIGVGIMIGLIHVLQVLVSKAPPTTAATIPTMFHSLAHLGIVTQQQKQQQQPEVDAVQSVLRTVCSCIVTILLATMSLITGAPIGPEVAITAMARTVANIVSRMAAVCYGCCCCKRRQEQPFDHNNIEDDQFKSICVQTSMAAAVSSILYLIATKLSGSSSVSVCSPILLLGPLLLHEMSVISRPNSLTIDGNLLRRKKFNLQKQRRRQQQQQHTTQRDIVASSPFDRISTSDELAATTTLQYGLLQQPLLQQQQSAVKRLLLPGNHFPDNNDTNNVNNEQHQVHQQEQQHPVTSWSYRTTALRPNEHDTMETLTLNIIASAAAIYSIKVILSYLDLHTTKDYYLTARNSGSADDYDDDHHRVVYVLQSWHLLVAMLIGIGCGFLSSTTIILLGLCRMIRRKLLFGSYRYYHHRSLQQPPEFTCNIRTVSVVFILPILACIVHACLTNYVSPHTSGIGLSLLQAGYDAILNTTVSNTTTTSGGVFETTTAFSPTIYDNGLWIKTIFCRSLSLVISVGLGGLVGGVVVPIAVNGLCVGVLLCSCNPFHMNLPMSFTIGCCTAACVVSICPTPFTAVLATIFILLHNDSNNSSDSMICPILIACLSAFTVTGGSGIIRIFELFRHGEPITDHYRTTNRRLLSELNSEERFYYHNDNNNDKNNSDDCRHPYHHQNSNGGNLNGHDVSEDELILRDVRSTIFGNS